MSSPNKDVSEVKDVRVEISGPEEASEDLRQFIKVADEEKNKGGDVLTFSIEPGEANTAGNKYKEATFVTPHLVRKIDSCEILPKPFKTTNQLIFASVLSLFCCICIGTFACEKAVEAKIMRNRGLYVVARKKARCAIYIMIAAIVTGSAVLIITLLATEVIAL